jgi:hypothetical protein
VQGGHAAVQRQGPGSVPDRQRVEPMMRGRAPLPVNCVPKILFSA